MLAKGRMTGEIACALEIDEEAAVDKISQYLPEDLTTDYNLLNSFIKKGNTC